MILAPPRQPRLPEMPRGRYEYRAMPVLLCLYDAEALREYGTVYENRGDPIKPLRRKRSRWQGRLRL